MKKIVRMTKSEPEVAAQFTSSQCVHNTSPLSGLHISHVGPTTFLFFFFTLHDTFYVFGFFFYTLSRTHRLNVRRQPVKYVHFFEKRSRKRGRLLAELVFKPNSSSRMCQFNVSPFICTYIELI